ncbi:MAG: hypothetical protein ACXVEF_04235 [Polyangiales bacterium]
MKRHARFGLLVSLVTSGAAFAACSSSSDTASVTCGPGTELSGSSCVPTGSDTGGDLDTGTTSESGTDAGGEAAVDAPSSDLPTFAGIASVSPAGADRLLLTWAAGTDAATPSDELKYVVYAATKAGDENFMVPKVVTSAGATSVLITDLDPGTYFFVVRAQNKAGKQDKNTVEKSGTPAADTMPPTFGGAKAAEPADGARVKLTWDPAADDLSAAGGISYLVYYSVDAGKETFAIPFAVSAPGATSIVTPPLPATKATYHFVVRARDAAGNVDANKNEVTSESGTDTKAPIFSGCNAAVAKDAGGITVFWDPATDDVTPGSSMKYLVYGAQKASDIDFSKPALASFTGGSSGVVTGLLPGTQYFLVCRARDASENEDDNKTIVSDKTKTDSIPPTFAGLATIANLDSTSVDLTWTAATDDQTDASEIEYWIYESTTSPVDTSGMPKYKAKGVTTYKVTGLTPANKLYWVVRAADAAGNKDTNTVEKSATTLVSFALNIQPIFTNSCAVPSCHSGTTPPLGMSLEEGKAYTRIADVIASETTTAPHVVFKRVKPGDSANSWLYKKITGTQDVGEVMPPPTSGGTLSPAEKDIIKSWIDQGALNN